MSILKRNISQDIVSANFGNSKQPIFHWVFSGWKNQPPFFLPFFLIAAAVKTIKRLENGCFRRFLFFRSSPIKPCPVFWAIALRSSALPAVLMHAALRRLGPATIFLF